VLPWMVLDGFGSTVAPIDEFLLELMARGNSAASCRSYAYDLLRWLRFLAAVEVPWDRAVRAEIRDFVLWLRTAHNPARDRRRADAPAPGSVNPKTGKTKLRAGYAPATINHALTVLAAFYDFHVEAGSGPLVSPVPSQSRAGRRPYAHHNPMEPFARGRRADYRQNVAEFEPRSVPDPVLDELFASLGCHRDRALVSMFLTSGARAAEMLGMCVADVRPGEGRIYVASKGLAGAKQACPASPEAFSWLALYLAELGEAGLRPGPGDTLWWTRRRPLRPLTYTALRAMLMRVNDRIGTDVTWHDLRHTLCLRLVNDPEISLADVQTVMRHRQITATSRYLRPRIDEVIAKVHEHYQRPEPPTTSPPGWIYDPSDFGDLFGAPE
jgi:integrase/recombinase XerC